MKAWHEGLLTIRVLATAQSRSNGNFWGLICVQKDSRTHFCTRHSALLVHNSRAFRSADPLWPQLGAHKYLPRTPSTIQTKNEQIFRDGSTPSGDAILSQKLRKPEIRSYILFVVVNMTATGTLWSPFPSYEYVVPELSLQTSETWIWLFPLVSKEKVENSYLYK